MILRVVKLVPMLRRHALFLCILSFAAVTRFLLLFVSQSHVHSDEAIIGLMGKHILEGRYFPFYMYGQAYNAGAAWEAYLATIPFSIFGVGVFPLKTCILCLSLACLVLVYEMARRLYGIPVASLAALAFALSPSLLKWHFQVRGYSFYFLSVPIAIILFDWIDSSASPRARQIFLFGVVAGLSIWGLELALPLFAVLWLLLALRRKLSPETATAGVLGFVLGYGPAIAFNLTHNFANWHQAFFLKATQPGDSPRLFQLSTFVEIFSQEMPKFFGPDTVLWYYPETPWSGYVFYFAASAAVGAAVWAFVRTPRGPSATEDGLSEGGKDLLMILLTLVCFVPYLVSPTHVPSYFLGGCVPLSVLMGRMLQRSITSYRFLPRLFGWATLAALCVAGLAVIVDTASHNQIETLTQDESGTFSLTRIPARDLEAVERHLSQKRLTSVWATVSFVYPLIFESQERLAASNAIFGWDRNVYPNAVRRRSPDETQPAVFVMEASSPYRAAIESQCKSIGSAPLVTEFGTLTVIEAKPLVGFHPLRAPRRQRL
jgi:hypothetical protein